MIRAAGGQAFKRTVGGPISRRIWRPQVASRVTVAMSQRSRWWLVSALVALTGWPLAAAAAPVELQVHGREGKPLADAVIFLESREARALAKPAQGVEIEQIDREFRQRVTVVPVGTSVQFPNRDKVRHHVYSFSPAKPFELKLYQGTPVEPVTFDKSGIAVLGCNIHDQMVAWVVVVDTPYYARSNAAGKVRLEDVPPGSYRLRSWHADLPPGSPALDQALTVGTTGATATVRLPL